MLPIPVQAHVRQAQVRRHRDIVDLRLDAHDRNPDHRRHGPEEKEDDGA